MKKVLLILTIVVLSVLAVLAMTKPDRTAHYNTLKGIVMRAIEKRIDKLPIPYESQQTKARYTALGIADEYLRHNLWVYEETFYNRGVIVFEDYFIPVSVGVMGHVFLTFDEKDVDELTKRIDILEMINESLPRTIKDKYVIK